MDIQVEEARALGIRMTVTRGSMNLSQKDGGLPPDSVVQSHDVIMRDSERVLALFHDPKTGRDDPDWPGAVLTLFQHPAIDAGKRRTGRKI